MLDFPMPCLMAGGLWWSGSEVGPGNVDRGKGKASLVLGSNMYIVARHLVINKCFYLVPV